MTGPDPQHKVLWHYPDDLRADGEWTLCDMPKPPDPAGVAWPCDPCLAERKRRRAVPRET